VYADIEAQKQFLARLQAIDVAEFPEQEALTMPIVRQIEMARGVRFKDWEMPVSQFGGIHINAPSWSRSLLRDGEGLRRLHRRLRQLPRPSRRPPIL